MPKQKSPDPIPRLGLICEKQLAAKCKPRTLAYCPSMDLLALVTEDEQVHVFRFNGQEALGGPFVKTGVEFKATRWKLNGRMLAIAGSDRIVRLLSSQSGKTVHELRCESAQQFGGDGKASISCLGWGVHIVDAGLPVAQLARIKAEIPRDLAALDVERSLPKLSVLPSSGDSDDIFSSRASLDSVFDMTADGSSGEIDILVVGFDDGTVHLRTFDCFEIGSLNVETSFPGAVSCKALAHTSATFGSTHYLLFSVTAPGHSGDDDYQLHLLTLDLQFITKSGQYLSLLASKVTSLQNLLRYIKQAQNQVYLLWKNAQDLPSRYIANADEDLEDKCQCDFVTAAYHLLVTGDCFEPLKEFLVDQVGERGHKRWEKAVAGGYESVRGLIHECLLPALERCSVILSRLIGLSKYHRLSPTLGLETKELKECVHTIDSLNLLAHKVLIHCNNEYREFCAFSHWLRHEIDLQAADPLSNTAQEEMEKSDTVDSVSALNYIRGAMTDSALDAFIKPPSPLSAQRHAAAVPSTQDGSSFYELYKKLLRQHEQQQKAAGGENAASPSLPTLGDLISRLSAQCDRVFKRIADTQRRGIFHRSPLSLSPDCDAKVADMRACIKKHGNTSVDAVQIASRSKKYRYRFYMYRVYLETVNGMSSTKSMDVTTISLRSGRIEYLKFVEEDNVLMLLWRNADEPSGLTYLVQIPLNPFPRCEPRHQMQLNPAYATGINRQTWEDSGEQVEFDLLDPDREGWCVRHAFRYPSTSEPTEFAINAQQNRRAVCVLESAGLRYSVLDLDYKMEESEEGDGDGDEEEKQGEKAETGMPR